MEDINSFDKVEKCREINLERLGETKIMNCGEIAFIVEYNSSINIVVQFKTTKELVKSTYSMFRVGEIKSHFTASVYGNGITGLTTTQDINGKKLRSYVCWTSMLQRCYSAKYQKKHFTYVGCEVCDEWKYYSNFKAWFDVNYYEIEDNVMNLDKDILFKGNKIYSPENCIFAPEKINTLFIKRNVSRGDLPIGVTFRNLKYQVTCSDNNGKNNHLGSYNNKIKAFNTYKDYKEKLIAAIANEYKYQIPSSLYNAMMKYTVDISD